MKRWIHASTTRDTIRKISEAKKVLQKYSEDQIQVVRECQDEITKAISKYYTDDLEAPGPVLSEIKRDYMSAAYEDDLLDADEFEEILDALDIIDIELAAPYA